MIQRGVRCLDFEYSVASFLRDLPAIRRKTFKDYTIYAAFKETGIWPVSLATAIKKRRQYTGKRARLQKRVQEACESESESNSEPELPALPRTLYDHTIAINTILSKGKVADASDGPVDFYRDTLEATKIALTQASLLEADYQNLQTKVNNDLKQRLTSRRVLSKGGRTTIGELKRRKLAIRRKVRQDSIRKKKREISIRMNKAKKVLLERGVLARCTNRENKKKIAELLAEGASFIPVELYEVLREPDKNPTDAEKESLLPQPDLQQALVLLEEEACNAGDGDCTNNDQKSDCSSLNIELVRGVDDGEEGLDIPSNQSSSGDDEEEVSSIAESEDSIQRQADFISL